MEKAQPSRLIPWRLDLLMDYLSLLWRTTLDKSIAQIPLVHSVLDLSKSKMVNRTHQSLSLSCQHLLTMMMVTPNSMVSKWMRWTTGPKPRNSLVWTKKIHWEFHPQKESNCPKINWKIYKEPTMSSLEKEVESLIKNSWKISWEALTT